MAPRAYWKGYLKLSLVSCPVALFPASSEREKISFNQINKKTGNRIRYRKVDAETGDGAPCDEGEDEAVDLLVPVIERHGRHANALTGTRSVPSLHEPSVAHDQ